MPINLCQDAPLVNMGRGKVVPMVGNTKKLSHIDQQFHNGQSRDSAHYPSTTHAVLSPGSNLFRPLVRVDNMWKTSGDNVCPLR